MISHASAVSSLTGWLTVVKAAKWRSFKDVRSTYSTADQVRVGSGKTVVVFNIKGNAFRLIAALHYDGKRAYVLRFLTHAEYGRDRWKEDL